MSGALQVAVTASRGTELVYWAPTANFQPIQFPFTSSTRSSNQSSATSAAFPSSSAAAAIYSLPSVWILHVIAIAWLQTSYTGRRTALTTANQHIKRRFRSKNGSFGVRRLTCVNKQKCTDKVREKGCEKIEKKKSGSAEITSSRRLEYNPGDMWTALISRQTWNMKRENVNALARWKVTGKPNGTRQSEMGYNYTCVWDWK